MFWQLVRILSLKCKFILKSCQIRNLNFFQNKCFQKIILNLFGRNGNFKQCLVPETMSLLDVQIKVCMALLQVRCKVCIAPFYVPSKFTPCIQTLLRNWSRAMQTFLCTLTTNHKVAKFVSCANSKKIIQTTQCFFLIFFYMIYVTSFKNKKYLEEDYI